MPAADYWPDGLDQSLKGADAKITMDNVAKALQGYRTRDASRGVPDKPEGYLEFDKAKDFKIDPKNQPFFDNLKTDPAFKVIAAEAHKRGIGQGDMLAMYQAGLNSMAEAGLLDMPVDVAAEKAALVPDAAKNLPADQQEAAVQKRLNDNYAFLDLAVSNMGLPKELAQFAELSLADSAKGHQLIEWMRGRLQGAGGTGPGAHGNPGGGGDTREGLKAELAALNRNDPKFQEKHAELTGRYRKFFGE